MCDIAKLSKPNIEKLLLNALKNVLIQMFIPLFIQMFVPNIPTDYQTKTLVALNSKAVI